MRPPPFQTLLDEYGPCVHRFLLARVGRVDADDCYQETWIAALRAYPSLRHHENLRGWILRIAARKAIDHARARRRAPVPVGVERLAEGRDAPVAMADRWVPGDGGAPGDGGVTGDRAAAGDGGAAGDRAAAAADRDALWEAVRRLPPKQCTAVALRYGMDASYALIAATMATSEDAARRNVHEGLKRLRREYER